jgi:hypothetical protein
MKSNCTSHKKHSLNDFQQTDEITYNLVGKFWRFKITPNKRNVVKLHHNCEKCKSITTKPSLVALIN